MHIKIQKNRHARLRGNAVSFGLMEKYGLLIAFPASLLIFLTFRIFADCTGSPSACAYAAAGREPAVGLPSLMIIGSLTPCLLFCVFAGGLGTGSPDRSSCLFYNQVVLHPYDTFNTTGNFCGLCGSLARINKTA